MRAVREWAPMALVLVLMLTVGLRVIGPTAEEATALQGEPTYPPAAQTQTAAAAQQVPTSTTDPASQATVQPSPTSDPNLATATSDPGAFPTITPTFAEPTIDPGVIPTEEPTSDPFLLPTEQQASETPTAEATATNLPTPTPTPEGRAIACLPGSVAELTGGEGDLLPGVPLLIYLDDSSLTPTAASLFSAFDSGGGEGTPTFEPLPPAAPGFNGRVVGSGTVRFDGYFRLGLALGRLRPGSYPVQVRERTSQKIVGKFTCNVGNTPITPLAITPRATPAPERGLELACIRGDELQVTGLWRPRNALLASFNGQFSAGASVLDDGTYNLQLRFDEPIGGRYIVEITERDTRTLLSRFTCIVPIRPTITPRNDRP